MNVKVEEICRLCLKVAESDFQIIDENARKIFEVLLLRVNLDIIKDPIICKDCAEAVEKCFNFKSSCIDADELIFSYAIDKRKAMVELQDIHKDGKDLDTIDDNFIICRFCSSYLTESNFVLLNTLKNDVTFAEMLQRLMPEMDFEITKNPIICTTCKQDLEHYVKFAKNCLDVEEKITKYLQNEGTPSSAHVKLGEILDHTLTSMIKQEVIKEDIGEEHSEGYGGELIKTEEIALKDEEVNFNESACETPSDLSLYKLNMAGESKFQIENTQLTRNSSSVSHLINRQSNMISEIGMGKAYQKRDEGEDNKKTNQMLSTEKIFKCAMCIYETKHKDHLKEHMLIHKDIRDVKMYKCSTCTYETKYKRTLKRHTLSHKDITEVEMYKCSICAFQTKHKDGVKKHMIIHKDATEVEMYKCTMCTYETRYKGSLKIHMLIHKDVTEVEMYKCSMCTYETKHKSSLKSHILIHKDVTEVEMYKCSMCTYETKHKCGLRHHMLIHKDITEVEMYKCTTCTYETNQKGRLKHHMLIHKDVTEVEMYKCSMCTYEARRKRSLKDHMLIHKDVTEVEMYKCSLCTYETKRKKNLKNHMLIHKDVTEVEMYKCSMCTYETKHKSSLKSHMLNHKDVTEVEMYKCSMCTYETKHKRCLKSHMLIHKVV